MTLFLTGNAQVFRATNRGVAVRFTQLELDAMWLLARKRQDAKNGGATDRRSDSSISNIQMHYIGIKGEYGVAKYLGVGFDMRSLTDGDDYGDISLSGWRIEVKNLQDWLVFTPGTFRADIAVLVNPLRERLDPRVRDKNSHAYKDILIRGWIYRDTFIHVCFEHSFGYGARQCMRPESLSPIDTIFDIAAMEQRAKQ